MSPEFLTTDIGPLFTVAEVADTLRVSKMTVYRLVRDGTLPAIRIGNSFRVPAAALRDYLTHCRATTA